MNEFRIERRDRGDVTILDVVGRLTLGEGSIAFREAVKDLVSIGRVKVVINLGEMPYFDSSGVGELVSAFTTVCNNGGEIVLSSLTRKIEDALMITKLYTVFEVFPDVEQALEYFNHSRLRSVCPLCGSLGTPAAEHGAEWPPQVCKDAACGAKFSIAGQAGSGVERIERVRLETYPGEYCEAVAGRPHTVSVVGRLNLFSSSALVKICKALPEKVVLFDLRGMTEITPEGRDALLKLSHAPNARQGAVVSLEGLSAEQQREFGTGGGVVFQDHQSALGALNERARGVPKWPARFMSSRR